MVARCRTVAFQGIEVMPVDVQVQLSNGLPAFAVVGLPHKAVDESRERVRGALGAIGLALLPPLDSAEILEVSMIASLAGQIAEGKFTRRRPFRAPHHCASMATLIGGGCKKSLLVRIITLPANARTAVRQLVANALGN